MAKIKGKFIDTSTIDEAHLKLDEGPTNDFVLTADNTKSGGMKWVASSSSSSSPFEESFVATAAQTNFTLSNTPVAAWVWVNGAAQDASTWSISSDDIILSTGAANSDAVEIYYLTAAGVAVGVTSIAAGDGLDFTTITTTGDIILGTPGTTTSSTTNEVTSTSHTHQLDESGISITASQVSDFDTEVSNNTSVSSNATFTATPSTVITAGTNLSWSGNTLNATGGGATNLSLGTLTATTMDVNSDTGTNVTLVEADTTNAGILGSDKWDEIVASTSHLTADGSSHTFINQDVTSASTPTFTNTNFSASTDKNYVTDAEATVIGNTSNTNSGDNAANTTYANDYRAANFVSGTDYEPAKGADDNFVTDAEKVVIGNTSNTNTGDNSSNTTYDNRLITSGATTITVSSSTPSTPATGDLWVDTT